MTASSPSSPEPIAIIGIGCRFPGGVYDTDSFWRLLRDGVDAISEIPPSRFDLNEFYDPRPATPGKVMTRFGGFLDHMDEMDAYFFGVSPREAERIDPQQRLLMEVAWEALENAGLPQEKLIGRQAGVYVAQWLSDFEARLFANPSQADFYMTTGSGRYTSSGRLSYLFGLQGPSLTVDTACSSSLVAVHLACQSLRTGESEIALAGAVNVILQPQITIAYSQSKMMAPDGRCKFGDARANGYVRSEGAAAIVLKRLSDAQRDGDPIYAVVIGSAVNNDGQSSGFLTTPGGAGQEEMLRLAYRNAGIAPGAVQYVEAHGTGTLAGDPVEIGALGAVLGDGRDSSQPCKIGSVKTNFGHTEGAAGLAGLIKVALALQHRQLPPSLHYQTPNPAIPWDRIPLRVQSQLEEWPAHDGPALAGVSAFGIAGTNAHVVLQEAPIPHRQPLSQRVGGEGGFLPLSARSPEALAAIAGRYAKFLSQTDIPLADILYTASRRRTHHEHRLGVWGNDKASLAAALEAFHREDPLAQVQVGQAEATRKIVFVFPGQGGQWLGMGCQLLQSEPAFAKAIRRCEAAFQPYVDWSLTEQLAAGEAHSRLAEIDVVQPILFAVEIALAETWRAWGVEPDAVVGHSMGEPAAAYIAGALSLEDAARVICTRSRLMKRVSGKGAMAVVELTLDQARAAITGYEDRLSVAVSNGPRSTVLSGDPAALEAVAAALQESGVFVRPVKVDVAAHSPHMDALRPELAAALAEIQPRAPAIPIYSTVTGALADFPLDAAYWGRNLRQPVLFSTAVEQLSAAGFTVFIECSPHPVLLTAIDQSQSAITIPSMRRNDDEAHTLQTGLARLYCQGVSIHWERMTAGRCVSLPAYPWQRERFWAKEAELDAGRSQRRAARLLETVFESPARPGVKIWQATLSLEAFPYLADHRVGGVVLLPAAAFVELALEATGDGFTLEALDLSEALPLQAGKTYTLQVIRAADSSFEIVSRAEGSDEWIHHIRGRMRPDAAATVLKAQPDDFVLEDHSGSEHMARMRARGLDYGPAFQGVTAFRRSGQAIFGQVRLPASLSPGDHVIHPAILDACFQLLIAALDPSHAAGDAFLPVKIARLKVFASPKADASLSVSVTRLSDPAADQIAGDICLLDEQGQVLLLVERLEMRRFRSEAHHLTDMLFTLAWKPAPERPAPIPATGRWLIASDDPAAADQLAAWLQAQGAVCAIGDAPATPCRDVIFLATRTSEDAPAAAETQTARLLALVRALAQVEWNPAPRLWVITLGAQAVLPGDVPSPALAALWGLAATIAHEFPSWRCTRIDLDSQASLPAVVAELLADSHEPIALRQSQHFVLSLEHAAQTESQTAIIEESAPAAGRPFCLETSQPGRFDALKLRAVERLKPQAHQVEIAIKSTGLNFMNVMAALGVLPGYANGIGPLGIECAGVISAVGTDVSNFQIGDEVLAVAFHSLGTHAIADRRLVQAMPVGINFDQAASIPIAFLTAYYALCRLGRMQCGEKVLVHSAAGGVGLAAVQLAQHIGAEIFATAGSDEKRAYLRSLGVQHVMDSRTLDFADQVMALTDGQGVDLVLNSLSGEAIPKSLAILAPYGRFLEIGKRDIYANTQLGLLPFQKNLSYSAIDLDRLARERPAFLGELFAEVMDLLQKGAIHPLPVTVFPANQAADAFHHMAQAKHIGKIVVSLADQNVDILPARAEAFRIRPDRTYLITGGLGALGLAVAEWLADQGARHLALVGRSGADNLSAQSKQTLDDLQAAGIEIKAIAADIAQEQTVVGLLRQISETMPPLAGIVHAAGVLDDGIILQQTPERIHAVMAPKAAGAWHLHRISNELDFFVFFSSVTAPFGSPGQGNYAAANAFLDGLAHARRAAGLPALAINWGPWSQIGLAAQREQGGIQGLGGLRAFSPEDGLAIFAQLLGRAGAQVIAANLNPAEWLAAHPAARRSTLFENLESAAHEQPAATHGIVAALQSAELGRPRHAVLENFIKEQAAQVLRLPPARVDIHKPLRTLGMDSLMTIEFRNRLEGAFGLALSATLVWNYPTVAEIAPFLAEKAGIALDEAQTAPPESAPVEAVASELDDLSTDDLSAMLADELDALDDLLNGA